jgi:hypothetical protein
MKRRRFLPVSEGISISDSMAPASFPEVAYRWHGYRRWTFCGLVTYSPVKCYAYYVERRACLAQTEQMKVCLSGKP